jgi:hypothetical protein
VYGIALMARSKPISVKRLSIHGLADKAARTIEIQKTLKGRDELAAFVHEAAHIAMPFASEKTILRLDDAITDVLWREGYRKRKSNNGTRS